MLFGLTNTPAVFQTLGNYILQDMLNYFVFVYFLIVSKDENDRVQHVQQRGQQRINCL